MTRTLRALSTALAIACMGCGTSLDPSLGIPGQISGRVSVDGELLPAGLATVMSVDPFDSGDHAQNGAEGSYSLEVSPYATAIRIVLHDGRSSPPLGLTEFSSQYLGESGGFRRWRIDYDFSPVEEDARPMQLWVGGIVYLDGRPTGGVPVSLSGPDSVGIVAVDTTEAIGMYGLREWVPLNLCPELVVTARPGTIDGVVLDPMSLPVDQCSLMGGLVQLDFHFTTR